MDYIFYIFLNTTVTRIGAVLLLIFGAQILIGFYRYNLKLAAFYDARADAIELLDGGSLEDLPALVATLSADQIDMGKSPNTPTEETARLLEALVEIKKKA